MLMVFFMILSWLKDPSADVSSEPPVGRKHIAVEENIMLQHHPLPLNWRSNPLGPVWAGSESPPDRNQTLPAEQVYSTANAVLCDMLRGVETSQDLDNLVEDLSLLR